MTDAGGDREPSRLSRREALGLDAAAGAATGLAGGPASAEGAASGAVHGTALDIAPRVTGAPCRSAPTAEPR